MNHDDKDTVDTFDDPMAEADEQAETEPTLSGTDESTATEDDAQVDPDDDGEDAVTGSGDGIAAERDEYLDKLRRLKADFENYQKRMEREKTAWREQLLADFMKDLLPLLDDLERAIAASRADESQDSSGLLQGVEMIHDQFLKYLESHGLTPIEIEGKPFDPVYCEAVMQVESADHPDKTVLAEFRRGYTVNERVLRPAQV